MGEYVFGVSRRRVSRKTAEEIDEVAKRHGATFVEANLPGTGYRRWFSAPNKGEPFDSRTARAVLDERRDRHLLPTSDD